MATADRTPEPSTRATLKDEDIRDAVAATPPWSFWTSVETPARAAVRRREATYRRLLAAADLVSVAAALLIGVLVIDGHGLTAVVLLGFPAVIVVAKGLGLYDRDQHLLNKTTLEEVPDLFQMTVLTAFALWVLDGLVVQGILSSSGALALCVTLFVCLIATRTLARRVGRRIAPVERCVVLGHEAIAEELVAKLEADRGIAVEFVPLEGISDGRLDDPRRLAEVAAFLVENEIHRVVLAGTLGDRNREELNPVIGEIKSLGVRISLLPSVSRTGRSSFELDRVDGIALLGSRGYEFSRSSRWLKRAMDLAISGTALAMMAPVLVAIAVAIRLDSSGPVLYRQIRIGRHGQPFEMLKFRTMHERAHERRRTLSHLNQVTGGLFKLDRDPRVTRVGRLLRSFSIDELPQLWNVMRGQMSLVGPRPLITEEDRLIQGWHRQRLALTPGITGYWQVLGSARVPLDEMLRLDYSYVQNWSAWDDVKLLLRTVPLVLRRRGI